MEKKYSDRLTPKQFAAVKSWWKTSVEGGEAK
jgi:hypothetical protein